MAGHVAHAAGVAIQAAFFRALLLVLVTSLLMTVGILLRDGLLVGDGWTVILPTLAKGHREFAVPFSFLRKTSGPARETSVRIDLNADVGEAPPGDGRDAELEILSSVTSVNIACGGHAGGC